MLLNKYYASFKDVSQGCEKVELPLQFVHDESDTNKTEEERLGKSHIKFHDKMNVCQELRACKSHDFLEQKRRQKLRADSHELRQLQGQLQSALVIKQLKEQQSFLAQLKAEELHKKQEENKRFEGECEFVKQSILREEKEKKQKKENFRVKLRDQIKDMQQKRRGEFEEALRDREDMDRSIKQLHAEEKVKLEKIKLNREKLKIEFEDSCRDVKLQRQLEKEKGVKEAELSLAYQKKCDNIKAKKKAEKKRIEKQKEDKRERMGEQLVLDLLERQNRENLLLTLLVEEKRAKEDECYRKGLEKQVKGREILRHDIEIYRNERRIRKELEFKNEEEKIRKEYMQMLAERDKLDQLSDEKRRRKIIEHNKDLKQMIYLKRQQRANEIATQIADVNKILDNEKEGEQLVKEERMRMLDAVPKELLSYLPPGVLTNSDMEYLTALVQRT